MKLAIVFWISIAGFASGADPKPNVSTDPQTAEPQSSGELRRLDSVTWDLKTHTLSFVVQHGKVENGDFVPTVTKSYQITPDNATMGAALERRPVDAYEAKLLHQILDTLSVYCAQSVVKWEHMAAPSDSVSPDSTPAVKPDHPAPLKPVKIAPQPR
jgi:hypothetical protein